MNSKLTGEGAAAAEVKKKPLQFSALTASVGPIFWLNGKSDKLTR